MVPVVSLSKFANVEHARVCIGNYIRNKEWISTFFVRTSMEFYTEDYNRWSLLSRREFQAPEILSGRAYGRAVDWWAVGVSLFKMACGHLPFREGNESTILRQRILSDEVYRCLYSNTTYRRFLQASVT